MDEWVSSPQYMGLYTVVQHRSSPSGEEFTCIRMDGSSLVPGAESINSHITLSTPTCLAAGPGMKILGLQRS